MKSLNGAISKATSRYNSEIKNIVAIAVRDRNRVTIDACVSGPSVTDSSICCITRC